MVSDEIGSTKINKSCDPDDIHRRKLKEHHIQQDDDKTWLEASRLPDISSQDIISDIF